MTIMLLDSSEKVKVTGPKLGKQIIVFCTPNQGHRKTHFHCCSPSSSVTTIHALINAQ